MLGALAPGVRMCLFVIRSSSRASAVTFRATPARPVRGSASAVAAVSGRLRLGSTRRWRANDDPGVHGPLRGSAAKRTTDTQLHSLL